MVQIGTTDTEKKPRFAGLKKGQSIDTLTLAEALDLFRLPRSAGSFESEDVTISLGRFGPYVKHKSKFYSLGKDEDPLEISLERAIEIIEEKRTKEINKTIKVFRENEAVKILNGRYGPYISYNSANYKITKGANPETLTLEDCMKIIRETEPSKKKIVKRRK